ncbi:MAG: hypothetical protein ABEJ61_08655 [Haloferacaceae archaeon]
MPSDDAPSLDGPHRCRTPDARPGEQPPILDRRPHAVAGGGA